MSVFRPRSYVHKDSSVSIEYSSQMASSHSTSELTTPPVGASGILGTRPVIIETKFDSPPHEMIRIEYSNGNKKESGSETELSLGNGANGDAKEEKEEEQKRNESTFANKKITRASLKHSTYETTTSSFEISKSLDSSSSDQVITKLIDPDQLPSSPPSNVPLKSSSSSKVLPPSFIISSSSVKKKNSFPHSISSTSLTGKPSSSSLAKSSLIRPRMTVNHHQVDFNQGEERDNEGTKKEAEEKVKKPESQSLVSSVNQLIPRARESRSLSIHSIHFLHPDDTSPGHFAQQSVPELSSRIASRRGSSNRSSGDQMIIEEDENNRIMIHSSQASIRRSSNTGRGSIGAMSSGRRSIGGRSIGRRSITSALASPIIKVSKAINRRRGKGEGGNKSRWSMKRLQAETKAAKTVGIIVGGFILCWLPFFTSYLTRAFCPEESCVPNAAMSIFTWLGYCNSAINPIIYGLFSRDFRKAFRNILFKCSFKDDPGVAGLIRQIHLPTFLDNEGITPRRQGSHHQIATTDFP